MKSRKIFVAVNLDNETKKYIASKLEILREKLNANWTKWQQFHVTLSFVGFVYDETIYQICQNLKNALAQKETFDLYFDLLELAPSADRPKMLWLKGGKSDALLELRKVIEETLSGNIQKKSGFEMVPHITLARIKRKQELSAQEIEKMLKKTQIKASVPVSSVDVMESVNEKGIWTHYPIEQIELR